MERPIIFNAENVKAILDGRKTMTRRVVKLKNYHRNVWDYCVPHNGVSAELLGEPYLKVPHDAITDNAGTRITCPYGGIGDRLWVRETWAVNPTMDEKAPRDISIVAFVYYKASSRGSPLIIGKWRPSIFMPRWASRILLEITALRVERVQEITEEDAQAEGCPKIFGDNTGLEIASARYVFEKLWDSLNAKRGYGWETNPWVWVIKFKMPEGR